MAARPGSLSFGQTRRSWGFLPIFSFFGFSLFKPPPPSHTSSLPSSAWRFGVSYAEPQQPDLCFWESMYSWILNLGSLGCCVARCFSSLTEEEKEEERGERHRKLDAEGVDVWDDWVNQEHTERETQQQQQQQQCEISSNCFWRELPFKAVITWRLQTSCSGAQMCSGPCQMWTYGEFLFLKKKKKNIQAPFLSTEKSKSSKEKSNPFLVLLLSIVHRVYLRTPHLILASF